MCSAAPPRGSPEVDGLEAGRVPQRRRDGRAAVLPCRAAAATATAPGNKNRSGCAEKQAVRTQKADTLSSNRFNWLQATLLAEQVCAASG